MIYPRRTGRPRLIIFIHLSINWGSMIAISVGLISNENVENYTVAIFVRFQRKEHLVMFYENPVYSRVLKEHVTPYCHKSKRTSIQYSFKEEFNFGVQFVLLISFVESAFGGPVEDALASLKS